MEKKTAKAAREAGALMRELGVTAPLRILDAGCGCGAHAIFLALEGHEVVGVDLCEGFLSAAWEEAGKRGVEVKFMKGDIREMEYGGTFDLILLMGTLVSLFDDEGKQKAMAGLAASLRSHGLMAATLIESEATSKNIPVKGMPGKGIGAPSGKTMEGKPQGLSDLLRLMEGHGLVPIKTVRDWKGAPSKDGAARTLIIARKEQEL
ncbi:MAG: class I SAM-dependent methyltransferase [Candidatus Eremiobacteraeota bacterium]|nr:class I SAM-dependent methyltransferase [Candidatus Eremiobacteraeota bacterium]